MNRRMILYILGIILMIEAAFMALPLIVAAIYSERAGFSFLATMVFALVAGFLLTLLRPKNKVLYAKDGFIAVALSWVVISLVGAMPFTLSGEIPSYLDAVFESVSGFTTTGASIVPNVELLSHCINFWRCFTHWLGGMGILVFMLAIVPLSGGQSIHLLRAESPGPSVAKIVPKMRSSAGILYLIYLGLTILQVLFYLFGRMSLFDALCHAFATAGTGGFGIYVSSLGHYSAYLQGVTTVFMILFGMNFNFYFFLMMRKFGLAFKNSEIRCYLGIIALSVVVIAWNVASMFPSVFEAFHHSAFTVASIITTTGFATVDFNLWPSLSKSILVCLMVVGACAGSTGGGMKVSRLIILYKTAQAELRRLVHPNTVKVLTIDGKRIGDESVRGVVAFLVLYLGVFVVSVLFLCLENLDSATTVTAVLATLNNIGPGLGLVGPAGGYAMLCDLSKLVLTLDMLFGRLELFPMILMLLPSTWRKR